MNTLRQVTKECYRSKPFEKVLSTLWEENPGTKFKRQDLLKRINRGDFGANLLATNSFNEGSDDVKLKECRSKGENWLDIQNLTYHYSHHNPNGNFHSQIKMLNQISGMGDETIYSLHPEAFKSQ